MQTPRNGALGWYGVTITQRFIANRNYIGEFQYNGHTCYMPELAIIEQDIWDAAQRQLQRNKERAKRNRKHDYLLSSHVFCSCEGRMVGNASLRRYKNRVALYPYYFCGRRGRYRHLARCDVKGINADDADRIVWEWVTGLLTDEEKLDKGLREMATLRESELEPKRARLETIDGLVAKAEAKVKRLAAVIADTDDEASLDALRAELKVAGKTRDALMAERETIRAELAHGELTEADRARIMALASVIRARLGDEPTFEQKRELLELLDLRAELCESAKGRALFVICGLALDGNMLPISRKIEEQSHC
ncbi:MAG: recombinase family protein [Chloroflexi bacterium]|nr:recombinase family protein [Chloroflexota bacterium]